jgi:hypothetical protein
LIIGLLPFRSKMIESIEKRSENFTNLDEVSISIIDTLD